MRRRTLETTTDINCSFLRPTSENEFGVLKGVFVYKAKTIVELSVSDRMMELKLEWIFNLNHGIVNIVDIRELSDSHSHQIGTRMDASEKSFIPILRYLA